MLAIAAALLAPAGAQADLVGPTLPAPHVGTALLAPPPPLVSGSAGETISYSWQRCRRYGTLVAADAPSDLWPLADSGTIARDTRGSADGQYARAGHALTADGPLSGEVDISSRFDGAADAVAAAGAPDVFSGARAHTVELWVRPQTVDARYRYLFSREFTTAAGRQGTGVWLQSRGIGFERYRDGVGVSITIASGLPQGTWSHVVASFDGTTMRLFVNGVQVGSKATAAPLVAGGTLELGAGAGGASGYLAGDLDEVALYDRAVTRSHVAAHNNAARSLPCEIIDGAQGASYTPTLADLGDTLQVMTIANRTTTPGGQRRVGQREHGGGRRRWSGREAGDPHPRPPGSPPPARCRSPRPSPASRSTAPSSTSTASCRYAKVAEPPLEYTWYTNAEANGTHTPTVKLWGPRSDDAR